MSRPAIPLRSVCFGKLRHFPVNSELCIGDVNACVNQYPATHAYNTRPTRMYLPKMYRLGSNIEKSFHNVSKYINLYVAIHNANVDIYTTQ